MFFIPNITVSDAGSYRAAFLGKLSDNENFCLRVESGPTKPIGATPD